MSQITNAGQLIQRLSTNMFNDIEKFTGASIERPSYDKVLTFFKMNKGRDLDELEREYARFLGPVALLNEEQQAKIKKYVQAIFDNIE